MTAAERPPQTCARCGHTTPTCVRCTERWPTLGGRVGDLYFCHAFVTGVLSTQTCYAVASREATTEG